MVSAMQKRAYPRGQFGLFIRLYCRVRRCAFAVCCCVFLAAYHLPSAGRRALSIAYYAHYTTYTFHRSLSHADRSLSMLALDRAIRSVSANISERVLCPSVMQTLFRWQPRPASSALASRLPANLIHIGRLRARSHPRRTAKSGEAAGRSIRPVKRHLKLICFQIKISKQTNR